MPDKDAVTFGTLQPDGSLTNVRVIKQSSINRCPHIILVADHYRADGTCRCDDFTHTDMRKWGYRWSSVTGRWI